MYEHSLGCNCVHFTNICRFLLSFFGWFWYVSPVDIRTQLQIYLYYGIFLFFQEATERVQGLLRVAQTQQQIQQQQQYPHQQQPPQSPDDKRISAGGAGRSSTGGNAPTRSPQVNGIVGRTTVPPNSTATSTTPSG